MSNTYRIAMREGSYAYGIAMREADNDHRLAMENAAATYRAVQVAYENRPQEVKDAEMREAEEKSAAETALCNATPYTRDTSRVAVAVYAKRL